MTTINKDIIREDLEFIADYVADILKRHNLDEVEADTVVKIDRRMNDILRRLDAK